MIPGFDLRLKSMRRALTAVILPALDADNQLAQEQAALMIGHLDMLATQWSRADAFARLCLDDAEALARGLMPEGGARTMQAAEAVARQLAEDSSAPEAACRALAGAMEDLVRAADADGEDGFRRALHRALLEHGNRQAARDRAWFAACGFDVNAAQLPSIDALLAGEPVTHG